MDDYYKIKSVVEKCNEALTHKRLSNGSRTRMTNLKKWLTELLEYRTRVGYISAEEHGNCNKPHVIKSLPTKKQMIEMAEKYVSGNKDESPFDVGVDAYIEGYTKMLGVKYDDLPK